MHVQHFARSWCATRKILRSPAEMYLDLVDKGAEVDMGAEVSRAAIAVPG